MTHAFIKPSKPGPLAREAAAKARTPVFAGDPDIRAARASLYADQDRARAEAEEADARERHGPILVLADAIAERVNGLLPALVAALNGPDGPVLRARLAELAGRPASS